MGIMKMYVATVTRAANIAPAAIVVGVLKGSCRACIISDRYRLDALLTFFFYKNVITQIFLFCIVQKTATYLSFFRGKF